MQKILNKIFGDPNKKVVNALRSDVEKINALEADFQNLSDDQLKAKTEEFKARLKKGEELEDVTFEAFANAREAAKRTLGQRHFDVQMLGGLVMLRRGIAEMRTGEGKTLTSTAPLYTAALSGKGCHLVTVNDYLAMRDAVWMGQVFYALGMTTGCIANNGASFVYDPSYRHGNDDDEQADEKDMTSAFRVEMDYLRPSTRQESYKCDITYGTNNEFGFDYLRDNMAPVRERMVQRGLHFAIIDEIDSILIDEARTPLIISAPAEQSNQLYSRFATIALGFKEDVHFNVDEKMRAATLTEEGITFVEKALGIENLYAAGSGQFQRFADSALKAQALYKRDVNYVVRDGEVIIVDEFTGRLMPGRRYSEGLHQAIEAKEGVQIQNESQTLATITFQNLFRAYEGLSGMTGTAATEAEEFGKIYELEVTSIPTNLPIKRKDMVDRIYSTEKGKFIALTREIRRLQEIGQPVLVGTVSIEKNEMLSQLLSREGIEHNVLNAKNHMSEAEIIAQAGRPGSVTIATNMAGRGVDIVLGGNPINPPVSEKVKELGGLHVIGTERHESRRIDNQLRGRSGRQGDPGSTQFYLSMDDDVMRVFGSDKAKNWMKMTKIPEDMAIENKIITRSIASAQRRVEGNHFDQRKRLLDYDDVLNKHREVIYKRRREILDAFHDGQDDVLKGKILELIEEEVEQVVLFHTGETIELYSAASHKSVEGSGDYDPKEIVETIKTIVPVSDEQAKQIIALAETATKDKLSIAEKRTKLIEAIMEIVNSNYTELEDRFGDRKKLKDLERAVIFRIIDQLWIDHLASMTGLRTGIGLRGYGQRDPLMEYKKEAFGMFQELLGNINAEISYNFFKAANHKLDSEAQQQLGKSLLDRLNVSMSGAVKTMGANAPAAVVTKLKVKNEAGEEKKVGRNDSCPCGSGKKYKKCCGK